ncbi:MAG: DUF4190 domain-containing protein [Aeromicrobium sp.]|uniref:DUF4190 domain-containing protein n=1 Tax=Aeromicrobium sp. TaxID=1871063 RepID=UPI0039E454D0
MTVTPPPPSPVPPVGGSRRPEPSGQSSNGLATAGFVLSLIGLLLCWIPIVNFLGILLGVLGVVLAGVGLAASKKRGAGKGLAIVGVVLGILAVVFAFMINAAAVDAIDDAVDDAVSNDVESSDGSDGTSRDRPVPLGTPITGGDWTVTVNSVGTVAQDSIGQSPAAGKVLLSVNVTAAYNGDDPQGSTPWASVKFVGPDGASVDSTNGSSLFVAENEFDQLTTLYPGASTTGDQLLEVPADTWQQGVLAVSPDLVEADTFVAVQ